MVTREYPTVLKRSKSARLLAEAHGMVITEEQSRRVIFAYLDEGEIETEIRFTGTTGRGRCEYRQGGRKVNLRLPQESTGKLTLGITLHEVAHAINMIDFGGKAHDDSFVDVLDNLVWSERYWDDGEDE